MRNQTPRGEELRPQARSSRLVTRELSDETLVYDLVAQQAHCLNKIAAAVWKYCDGQKTVAEIARQIEEDLNLVAGSALVEIALEQLQRANLLAEPISPAAMTFRQHRREALRRLGVGAVAALPLVTSVIAPLPVQAMTCAAANNGANLNPNGCPCSGASSCVSNCCGGGGNICVTMGSLMIGASCNANCGCANNCCGNGNLCATLGSVPSGSACRVNCECAAGLTCKGSPQRCLP